MPPMRRLQEAAAVRDDRNRMAVQPRVGAEHLRREFGLELDEVAGVEDAAQNIFHLVGQAMVGRQHARRARRRTLRGR